MVVTDVIRIQRPVSSHIHQQKPCIATHISNYAQYYYCRPVHETDNGLLTLKHGVLCTAVDVNLHSDLVFCFVHNYKETFIFSDDKYEENIFSYSGKYGYFIFCGWVQGFMCILIRFKKIFRATSMLLCCISDSKYLNTVAYFKEICYQTLSIILHRMTTVLLPF